MKSDRYYERGKVLKRSSYCFCVDRMQSK